MTASPSSALKKVSAHLKKALLTEHDIVNSIALGLNICFPETHISIEMLPSPFFKTGHLHASKDLRVLPEKEKTNLIKQIKTNRLKKTKTGCGHLYIPNREKSSFTDKSELKKSQKIFQTKCLDILYILLHSDEEGLLGIVTVHHWSQNENLKKSIPQFSTKLSQAKQFCTQAVLAFENLAIHQKIETLVSNKHLLQEKIEKDEKSLKHHISELTALYELSNMLSHSLNYHQLITLMFESIQKVFKFDLGMILLIDIGKFGEVITRVNSPIENKLIQSMQSNIIQASSVFTQTTPTPHKIRITTEKHYKTQPQAKKLPLKGFANVPLVFKEEILGMLTLGSSEKTSFDKEDLTFLLTLANQLSSHLGRLKLIKNLEQSKIESLIQSMTEGILMIDPKQEVEIVNPIALELLSLPAREKPSFETLESKLSELKILPLYIQVLKDKKPVLNHEIRFKNQVLLASIAPVTDAEKQTLGTVIVLRDFTEIHKINRIKSQRLEIMSQVNMIIRSITDLDNLLTVVMDFILNVTHTDMGSIMLKQGNEYITKVHSNFPDKVNRFYHFKNGETISEYVIRTRQVLFIEDYLENPNIAPNPKVSIDYYLGIPILIKDELIGMINIVQKYHQTDFVLTPDDIKTLEVITTLIGTAIHNALLYQKTIEKQKIDQELKVAMDIQSKLLPQSVPNLENIDIAAISVPAREIGGDYYDFFELEQGKIGILIADIVGKGVPAGLFMAMLKSILHAHLPSISSPKKAMDKMNALLYRDPVMKKFVPSFYGILDPKTHKFQYCNAGHEPPLWLSKNKIVPLDTPGIPLGGLEKSSYKEKSISLKQNDIIMLFTDGIVESRNSRGKDLGGTLVRHWIKKYQEATAEEIVKNIHQNIINYAHDTHQHDDLTLVAIKLCTVAHEKPIKTEKATVNSAKSHIRTIREIAFTLAKEMGFSAETAADIKLAVNEAHSNVIEHTYNNQESGEIAFRFIVYKDRLEIIIKDFAPGTDQRTIKKKEDLDSLEGSGLGVFLIDTIMDEVNTIRDQGVGTELHMIKYLSEANTSK
jgi:sigma-B regulation protein RsbU (phosphoserine phosphatase)